MDGARARLYAQGSSRPSGPCGVRLAVLFLAVLQAVAIAAAPSCGNITFLVASDLHYGYASGTNVCAAISEGTLDRMKSLVGEPYPASVGGTVDAPRGVVLVGDLTESGSSTQWKAFTNDWGLNGERCLDVPVYEGFGNHDVRGSTVASAVKVRSPFRPGVTNISANGYHYSWDWDFLHLVQLNIFPGNEVVSGCSAPDPRCSLSFLVDDLARCVGASGRPVILFHHYGADSGGWSAQQHTNYFETIKNYNVLAVFSGHTHGVRLGSWRKLYTCTDGTCGKFSGNFFVVHVTPTNLVILERKATNTWGASFRKTLPVFNPKLDTDKDGMPDWWEKHYGLSTTDARDAARDLDGDGQSDLAEYIAGTDPKDATDAFRISLSRPGAVTGAPIGVNVAGYVGRAYSLERALIPTARSWSTITSTPVLNSNQRLTFQDPMPPGSKAFYRVKVTLP